MPGVNCLTGVLTSALLGVPPWSLGGLHRDTLFRVLVERRTACPSSYTSCVPGCAGSNPSTSFLAFLCVRCDIKYSATIVKAVPSSTTTAGTTKGVSNNSAIAPVATSVRTLEQVAGLRRAKRPEATAIARNQSKMNYKLRQTVSETDESRVGPGGRATFVLSR